MIHERVKHLLRQAKSAPGEAPRERRILLIGGSVALAMALILPLAFYSDSRTYVDYAFHLSGQATGPFPYYRSAGYPLLMLLSGLTLFDSFIGLVLLQALMAVAVPLLIYRTVCFFNRDIAYVAAAGAILSLVPFLYMKTALTEQTCIFLQVLALYLAARFHAAGRIGPLYLLSVVLFLAALLRPGSTGLFAAFMLAAFVFVPARREHVALATLLTLALLGGRQLARPYLLSSVPGGAQTSSMTGKLLFFNVYLAGCCPEAPVFDKSNGPATRKLIETTERYLATPGAPARKKRVGALDAVRARHFFGRFENEPAALARYVLASPSRIYYWLLWDIADEALGPDEADRAMLAASLEALRRNPTLFLKYFGRNLLSYAVGPPATYSYNIDPEARYMFSYPSASIPVRPSTSGMNGLPERLQAEVRFDPLGGLFAPLRTGLKALWALGCMVSRPIVFLLMLFAVFFYSREYWRSRRAARCGTSVSESSDAASRADVRLSTAAVWTAFLAVMYNALTVCIFNEPATRYVNQTILLELVAAVAGARALRIGNRG